MFLCAMHALCLCFHWETEAQWLNLQQLNISALFLKAEVSGHTQVHSHMSLGSNAVESNTTARSYSRSEVGWGCFEWRRICAEGKWGQKIQKYLKIKFLGEGSLNNDILLFKFLEFLWEALRRNIVCLPRLYNWRRCYIHLSQNMNSPRASCVGKCWD